MIHILAHNLHRCLQKCLCITAPNLSIVGKAIYPEIYNTCDMTKLLWRAIAGGILANWQAFPRCPSQAPCQWHSASASPSSWASFTNMDILKRIQLTTCSKGTKWCRKIQRSASWGVARGCARPARLERTRKMYPFPSKHVFINSGIITPAFAPWERSVQHLTQQMCLKWTQYFIGILYQRVYYYMTSRLLSLILLQVGSETWRSHARRVNEIQGHPMHDVRHRALFKKPWQEIVNYSKSVSRWITVRYAWWIWNVCHVLQTLHSTVRSSYTR